MWHLRVVMWGFSQFLNCGFIAVESKKSCSDGRLGFKRHFLSHDMRKSIIIYKKISWSETDTFVFHMVMRVSPQKIKIHFGSRYPDSSLTGQKALIVRITGTWDPISSASPRYPDKTASCPDNENPFLSR